MELFEFSSFSFVRSQVQVKSSVPISNIPFSLLVRDPSSQIDNLNENKKFAEDVSASLKKRNNEKGVADYKFNLTIPRQETYVPLLKYKCTGDLRPVPIVSHVIECERRSQSCKLKSTCCSHVRVSACKPKSKLTEDFVGLHCRLVRIRTITPALRI